MPSASSRALIAMFDSRPAAEAARRALTEQGFDARQVHVEAHDPDTRSAGAVPVESYEQTGRRDANDPLPEDRGVSGFIRRMFSGVLMDDSSIRKYIEHAERGACALTVDVTDDAQAMRARSILAGQPVLGDLHTRGANAAAGTGSGVGDTPQAIEAASHMRAPEGSALPNASTGWDATGGGKPSIGGANRDPARPQGETRDAMGLDTDQSRPRGDDTGAGTTADDRRSSAGSDAKGHRSGGSGLDAALPPGSNSGRTPSGQR